MLDFPSSPGQGATYSSGGITWMWDGQKWVAGGSSGSGPLYLPITGGTLTGPLNCQQATSHIDNAIIGGSVPMQAQFTTLSTTGWAYFGALVNIGTGPLVVGEAAPTAPAPSGASVITGNAVAVGNFASNSYVGTDNQWHTYQSGPAALLGAYGSGLQLLVAPNAGPGGVTAWVGALYADTAGNVTLPNATYFGTTGTFWAQSSGGNNVHYMRGGNCYLYGNNANQLYITSAAGNYGLVVSAGGATDSAYFITGAGHNRLRLGANYRTWSVGMLNDGNFYHYDESAGTWRQYNNYSDGTLNTQNIANIGSWGTKHTAYNPNAQAWGFNGSQGYLYGYTNGSGLGAVTFYVSDERFKENVQPATEDALDTLSRLALYEFDKRAIFKGPIVRHERVGLIAQQVRDIIPEAVMRHPAWIDPPPIKYNPPKKDKHGNLLPTEPVLAEPVKPPDWDSFGEEQMMYSIDPNQLLTRCIAAIQQLKARIEYLEGGYHR